MKQKLPRLIALDLDETLLDEYSRLSPRNESALLAARAAGAEIVVATGRAMDTVPAELLRLPGLRYAITGNGAAVYDLTTGTAIRRKTLPPDAAEAVLASMAGLDVAYEVFFDGAAYAGTDYLRRIDDFALNGMRLEYVLETRRPVEDIVKFIRTHPLDSIAVIPKGPAVRTVAMERLKRLETVYVTSSHIRLIEVNHQDSTKASGLQFLAERLGVARQDTAAFGNGDNDAEMLAWASCGVSVAEGSALCRAAADHVCPSHRESGVAQAFFDLWGVGG